jgi:hypothetical protein
MLNNFTIFIKMVYTIEDIDKVLNFSSWDSRRKMDEFFRIDSDMYCNLGSDSTKTEKQIVKKNSKALYKAIQKIDSSVGTSLLYHMDK